MKLELEFRNEFKKATDGFKMGKIQIMMTPPIDEKYWVFRIKLHKDQAVVAFPKFGLMGIGFAQESNWNTNLPSCDSTKSIVDHIWENRKYPQVTYAILTKAVKMLQKASKYYKENELTPQVFSDEISFNLYFEKMEKFVQAKA